jgi:endonuclease YncB( thermonuclease family)
MIRLLAAAVIVLALPLAAIASDQVGGAARAIDGDTIAVGRQRVRLWGIDAPELRQACTAGGREWACGLAARRALAARLRRGPVACEAKDVDRYGRVVALCRVGGADLGAALVRSGFALAYVRYAADYAAEEAGARAARRGLWRGAFVQPWEWRKAARRAGSRQGRPKVGR